MDQTIAAAAGALLVAILNELRAQLRARQADRDRQDLEAERLAIASAGVPSSGDVDEE